jgi:hypothetical protein
MAVTYVANNSARINVASGNITLTLTSITPQAGDILVAAIACRNTETMVANTANGWVQVHSSFTGNNSTTAASGKGSLLIAYFKYVATNPDLTFYRTGGDTGEGQIFQLRGVNRTTPVGNTSLAVGSASVTGANCPSITAKGGNFLTMILGGGSDTTVSAQNCATEPVAANWTERIDQLTTSGGDSTLMVATATKTGDGSTGVFNALAAAAGYHVLAGDEWIAAVAPGAPTGLTVTAANTSQCNLGWTAPASDGGQDITGYMIERESPTGGGFSTLVANTASATTTYNDATCLANTQYNYRISAINRVPLLGSASTALANTTPAGVPGQVTGLGVSVTNSTSLHLSWTAPAANGSAIAGYRIERESPVGGGFSDLVANTATTATTYDNNGLTTNQQYNYRVSAINGMGLGAASVNAVGTPIAITDIGVLTGSMMGPPYF